MPSLCVCALCFYKNIHDPRTRDCIFVLPLSSRAGLRVFCRKKHRCAPFRHCDLFTNLSVPSTVRETKKLRQGLVKECQKFGFGRSRDGPSLLPCPRRCPLMWPGHPSQSAAVGQDHHGGGGNCAKGILIPSRWGAKQQEIFEGGAFHSALMQFHGPPFFQKGLSGLSSGEQLFDLSQSERTGCQCHANQVPSTYIPPHIYTVT